MSNDILFDNFIITDSKRVADQWADDSWSLKQSEEHATGVSTHTYTYTLGQKTLVICRVQLYSHILPLVYLYLETAVL